jgi:Na+/proline symporter
MDLIPSGLTLGDTAGPALFIIGWLFAGFSVIGQPHIMVRFMALDTPAHTNRARLYYYLWFVAFYFVANAVALISRVLLPESAAFDPELALPTIALELLHPIGVGMVLAGIFAATMSTADSLILSCSGSLAENLARLPRGVWVAKLSTVLVTVFALWLALSTNDNVFNLVISSWAVLAACFGPLLMVLALGQRPNQLLAVAMMLTGVIGVYGWLQFDYLSAYYEGTLAICAGFLVFAVGKALGFTQEPGTAEQNPEAGISAPTDL